MSYYKCFFKIFFGWGGGGEGAYNMQLKFISSQDLGWVKLDKVWELSLMTFFIKYFFCSKSTQYICQLFTTYIQTNVWCRNVVFNFQILSSLHTHKYNYIQIGLFQNLIPFLQHFILIPMSP